MPPRLSGARPVHFDFLDCIYRRGSNGEWLYSDITVPLHEEDTALPDQIARALLEQIQPDDIPVCQLAIGSHVDHLLVRQGAEKTGLPLLYDIDIPYYLSRQAEIRSRNRWDEEIHPSGDGRRPESVAGSGCGV